MRRPASSDSDQSDAETHARDLCRSEFQGHERLSSIRSASRPSSASSATARRAISPTRRRCRCAASWPARSPRAFTPSNTLMEALSRFQNEQRSVDYVRLGPAQAGTIDPPSPETLAAYFDEHKAAVPRARIPQDRLRRDHAGRDRQMVRRLRRRRQEAVRAAQGAARHAGEARRSRRSCSRMSTMRRPRATASRPAPRSTTSPRSASSARPTSISVSSPNRAFSIPPLRMRLSRCRRAKSASPCRASSASRWSRSA